MMTSGSRFYNRSQPLSSQSLLSSIKEKATLSRSKKRGPFSIQASSPFLFDIFRISSRIKTGITFPIHSGIIPDKIDLKKKDWQGTKAGIGRRIRQLRGCEITQQQFGDERKIIRIFIESKFLLI